MRQRLHTIRYTAGFPYTLLVSTLALFALFMVLIKVVPVLFFLAVVLLIAWAM